MYARPIPFTWGSFLLIQPSAQACQSLSRHIGVPSASTMHIQPLVPARSWFIFPSAVIAMTVAFFEIDGGAALIALAMVAASEPPPPFLAIVSCPDFALGSSLSVLAFSWAETVSAAMTNMPVATAIAFRMAPSVGCELGAPVAYRPSRRLALGGSDQSDARSSRSPR